MRTVKEPFSVRFTGDFLDTSGQPRYRDFGLSAFQNHPHITHEIASQFTEELTPQQIGNAQAVVVLSPRVTRRSLYQQTATLAVARFGVGFDSVDVDACTDNDVMVLIATGAVDRSVAEATLTWMLALSHQVLRKDALVRQGDWEGRSRYMGAELRRRTVGLVGFGRIARALVPMLSPFGVKEIVTYDPHVDHRVADLHGVRPVGLDELLTRSDFVSIHCPLTPQTKNLIGATQLAKMKPSAWLINTSRGGIIDEQALCQALRAQRIAGAGIDVFADEPLTGPHPLAEFDNVLLAPHCIAWTEELFSDIGKTVCQTLVEISYGDKPKGLVNPQVLQRPGFRKKWSRWANV
jgi:phosphoglycerate dehydrogenase-like enzyme